MTKMMAALLVIPMMMAGCGGVESQTAGSPEPSPSNAVASGKTGTGSCIGNGNGDASSLVGFAAVDFAFEDVPETFGAGEVTLVLANEGEVKHEMTLGRLPAGWTIEEVALGSSDSGTEIVGTISTIEPGACGKMTLELKPGRYGYICHEIEGTSGKAHYFRGMLGEFKVVK